MLRATTRQAIGTELVEVLTAAKAVDVLLLEYTIAAALGRVYV
jgi:hypothetical protein